MRIAIIGGGISGLAAAHRITELLPRVELAVFEAAGRLGGVLETVQRDGFLVERSADSFITKFPWAVDLCGRLGLAEELLPTDESRRRASVVHNGELLRVPDGFVLMTRGSVWPILATRVLSWRGKLRLLAEPLVPRRRIAASDTSEAADESVASFATRRLGREAFERLVQPLLAGIYTADAERLSMAATLPELVVHEQRHGSLARSPVRATTTAESGARYGLFVAPRDGVESMVHALAERLPVGSVRLNTPISAIQPRQKNTWLVTLGDGRTEPFDAVIVALSAPAAAKLIAGFDQALAAELAAIEYAGCAIVCLGYRRDQLGRLLDGFGFVVPRIENRPIIAASYASEKFPGRAPDGQVTVRVFIGGALAPEMVELPTNELSRIAHGELSTLLRIAGQPQWSDVARWPQSMPQYHVGHVARVARIEAGTASHPGLVLAGNAYHGVGIPQCIRSGESAANRVVAQLTSSTN
jgi:oxygen-dependent protoporphyrinogen oxidase